MKYVHVLTNTYVFCFPVPPTVDAHNSHEIKSFLRRYKKYLRKRTYQVQLEPMYNRLFEWIQRQQDHHSELVWYVYS
jgi:lipid II:glycine glycyltransferase (peptidoglycan interpeptide bridge formation enzyme)